MIYAIERITKIDPITKRSDGPHEREARRKGHRVEVSRIELSQPLILRYVDEDDAVLKTSSVEAYNSEWRTDNHLLVQTKNTVYLFRKESDK